LGQEGLVLHPLLEEQTVETLQLLAHPYLKTQRVLVLTLSKPTAVVVVAGVTCQTDQMVVLAVVEMKVEQVVQETHQTPLQHREQMVAMEELEVQPAQEAVEAGAQP
jgi:hypothetical protein